MKLTQEQIAKAKDANTVEELLALAKENGMELTEAEAEKYFAEWHKEGELADEELANVSAGCGPEHHIYNVWDAHDKAMQCSAYYSAQFPKSDSSNWPNVRCMQCSHCHGIDLTRNGWCELEDT